MSSRSQPVPSERKPDHTRPPKPLSDRHRIIATLMASGWSNIDIRKQVRCSEARLAQLRKEPRFLKFLEEVRAEVKSRLMESRFNITDAIVEDARENFDFIRYVRRDDDLDPKHRLRASLALLARQAPVVSDRHQEGGIHIHLGGRDLRGMATALREAKLIEGDEAAAIEAEFSDAEEPEE